MAKLADHSKWIEIGWVEYAAHQFGAPPTPKPEIYTYVKTGVEGTGGWAFHGQVTPGASVLFRIESSCGSVCTWIAKIYQAPTWVALRSYTFGTAAVNIEAYNEVDPGAPCKKHVVLATSPDAKVSWTNVTVKNSSDAWQYWSSGVSRSSTSDPYTSVWQNNYYKFTAERTGAATC